MCIYRGLTEEERERRERERQCVSRINGGGAEAAETQRGEREAVCGSSAEAYDGSSAYGNV